MANVVTASTVAQPGKYLTVAIDNEVYGIAVLKVREIIRLQKITPVPQLPEFVKGVINLRGRVIPIIDLRVRFGMKAENTERTCVVVVQVVSGDRSIQIGVIVDSVEEVANLTKDQIEPTPDFGVRIDTAYLLGMAKTNGRVLMLLEIDRVIATEELQTVAARTSQAGDALPNTSGKSGTDAGTS
jgi:purine-binding chemotaxis protein CheW